MRGRHPGSSEDAVDGQRQGMVPVSIRYDNNTHILYVSSEEYKVWDV